jgi:hypothetical protein
MILGGPQSPPDSANSGYTRGIVSGQQVALNALGAPAAISGSIFDFTGVYLTGAWSNGLNITISGLRNGAILYSQTVIVDTYQPTWFAFNYSDIDTLTFNSFGGVSAGYFGSNGSETHFVMDNFTFNQSVVPIPATAWFFGSGLLDLVGASRRRLSSI